MEEKKFEINVQANENQKSDAVVEASSNKKIEFDSNEQMTDNKAEKILSDISMKDDEVEHVEAERVQEVQETQEDVFNTVAGDAAALLGGIKEYIQSKGFEDKCKESAQKVGVQKEIVKNAFIKNILGGIANALGLSITVTGNLIIGAVNFIETIITTIVNFATSSLLKVIQVVTLNCGTAR